MCSNHYLLGQRDHLSGYYDKWYRYNSVDDGLSYDLGWRSVEFSGDIQIIDCNALS